MSRLLRPPIPYSIRLKVLTRQFVERGMTQPARAERETTRAYVDRLRTFMFTGRKNDLHHRPALINRRRYTRHGRTFYSPPANDADHLAYLLKIEEHDIETRVRGLHGQHSDLALARKNKRIEKKKAKRLWTGKRSRYRGIVLRGEKKLDKYGKTRIMRKWPKGRGISGRRFNGDPIPSRIVG